MSVIETTEGPVTLPMRFDDASMLALTFACPIGPVRQVLEPYGVEAASHLGRGLVQVAFYEYRDSPVGPYREMALAIEVTGGRRSILPREFFIVELPVTTAAARAAGREIWGYPKIVAGIDTTIGPRVECSVSEDSGDPDGAPMLSVAGTLGAGIGLPGWSFTVGSRLDGRLLRAAVDVSCRVRLARGSGLRVSVNGESGLAQRARELGVVGVAPTCAIWTTTWNADLCEGVPSTAR